MTTDSENAGRLQRGRFVPGVSGNPAGKKPGTRHRATRLAENLMAGDIEAGVNAVVNAAKQGDITAALLSVLLHLSHAGSLLPAASCFDFGRAVDEGRHVFVQLLARLRLDVRHVSGFVIAKLMFLRIAGSRLMCDSLR
jgi:hypothetical protein